MRSRALTIVFNRALVSSAYREALLAHLRPTLLEAGVPQDEIRLLELYHPRTLEQLADALEKMHVSTFDPQTRF